MARRKITHKDIPELIKSQAKEQGISITDLAAKTGTDSSVIYKFIRGRTAGYKIVFKLLNTLGFDVDIKVGKKRKGKK